MSVRPVKTQISPVWSESSLSAWRKLGSLATHWVHSEDSDQIGRMPRLIWVFAGRTLILLVCHVVLHFSYYSNKVSFLTFSPLSSFNVSTLLARTSIGSLNLLLPIMSSRNSSIPSSCSVWPFGFIIAICSTSPCQRIGYHNGPKFSVRQVGAVWSGPRLSAILSISNF